MMMKEDSLAYGVKLIRSGSYDGSNSTLGAPLGDYNTSDDPNGIYETAVQQSLTVSYTNVPFVGEILLEATGGTWAPYRFASYFRMDLVSLVL